jgi:hypothetical protein
MANAGIFLLRQFFITIPDELSEAARIDGCSEIGIFFRVVLPLARPALSVVALFAFMAAWNDYLGPLIFITQPQKYTLQLGLQAFQGSHLTEWNLLMAGNVMTWSHARALPPGAALIHPRHRDQGLKGNAVAQVTFEHVSKVFPPNKGAGVIAVDDLARGGRRRGS